MKILVTGGAGYIGSHTAMHLAHQGHEVVVLDNLSRGHRWAVKWGSLEKVDLRDYDRVKTVLRLQQPDAVLHFASLARVEESVRCPDSYYYNNLVGSLSLLRAMSVTDTRQIVFSSSCAVYGHPLLGALSELDPKDPINPYGRVKWMVEQAISDYSKAYGIKACSLRYFNAAGCDPGGEIGEAHVHETHLIPCVLNSLRTNTPIKVFGSNYNTPDGTCVRDYVHVMDLARAHRLALEKISDLRYPAYNLGTGQGYSVLEVIRSAERVTGIQAQIERHDRRPGDPSALVANSCLSKYELKWEPEWRDLDAIINSAWNWYRNRPAW